MELINVSVEVNVEISDTETAKVSLEQLRDLELSMVGGGMGDVLQ